MIGISCPVKYKLRYTSYIEYLLPLLNDPRIYQGVLRNVILNKSIIRHSSTSRRTIMSYADSNYACSINEFTFFADLNPRVIFMYHLQGLNSFFYK